MKFDFNMIDDKLIQIIGAVNGFAYKRTGVYGNEENTWVLEISFFTRNGEVLNKVKTSEKDCTMRSVEAVRRRVEKIIGK